MQQCCSIGEKRDRGVAHWEDGFAAVCSYYLGFDVLQPPFILYAHSSEAIDSRESKVAPELSLHKITFVRPVIFGGRYAH